MKQQAELQQIVDQIFELYDRFGAADYIGEPVSQIEHMSQCAELAISENYDDETVLAAFFHDIGHICVQSESADQMDGYGVVRHELIGANFLRSRGFSEKLAKLVENHVQAKRYLTFKYPGYYATLSDASKATLAYQGGIMNEVEAQRFESDPLFEESIKLRDWDDTAKEIGKPLINLSQLKSRAVVVLSRLQAQPPTGV